jgi:hypothetical protein
MVEMVFLYQVTWRILACEEDKVRDWLLPHLDYFPKGISGPKIGPIGWNAFHFAFPVEVF